MAFWGVVVKPKKPFRLKYRDFEGPRLHLSQVTLGSKKSKERIIVRCSVGDGPVVYLCSLLPGIAETCSLDLYFADDVIFSVKGSSSVHLVGYFEGTDDEDAFGEDVEDDGYSDEEDEEAGEDDSLNDFIVHDDSEYEDSEGTSDEDEPIMVPNSGVTIEEVIDEDPLQIAKYDSKKALVSHDTSLVAVKRSSKKLKKQDGSSGIVKYQKDSNVEGPVAEESQRVKNQIISDKGVADRHASSSEDEDGFRLTHKRKLTEADDELRSMKKSTETQAATSEPASTPVDDQEIPLKTEMDLKKAKKKKKKKGKIVSEQQDALPLNQATGSPETPFKQGDNARTGEVEENGTKVIASGGEQNSSKKGTVRKHANGLEIENVSMGKPDGKQATPGKKVGMIYTGKLRSNGKIFDSNVGRKPFFFRLGVGEVIKGWDIGVNGMRVGDKRRLTIPPDMGYGLKKIPGIPPNSWLCFDVELVEVK